VERRQILNIFCALAHDMVRLVGKMASAASFSATVPAWLVLRRANVSSKIAILGARFISCRCARPSGSSAQKRPFGGPEAVLAYLSRYAHRVVIAKRRLIAYDQQRVTFKVRIRRRPPD
jgi:Putative transposase